VSHGLHASDRRTRGNIHISSSWGFERIMTSEAVHASTPLEREHESGVSAAKITLIGTIVATVATVAVAAGGWLHDKPSNNAGGTVIQTSPFGSVGKVRPNDSRSEVTVSGWAAGGVDDVVVLIGPKSSSGEYWVANGSVSGDHWDAVVKTDPHLASDYTVEAYFNRGVNRPLAAGVKPLDYPPATSSAPSPPADLTDITQCAALYGQRCFTDPQWAPPAIYKPNA
jgi:hypothetical protein